MNERLDPFQLHAYVDGELAPDDVAALRAQKSALHARFDPLLAARHDLSFGHAQAAASPSRMHTWIPSRKWVGAALAATLVLGVGVGLAAGWFARGHADLRDTIAQRASDRSPNPVAALAASDARFGDFVRVAAVSHAIYTPEVRHPVEVPAADEAHLVAWLSKRLDAPLVVPHLGDAGWNLLGGRLLPAQVGPVAQFMYQDGRGRRLTLAVSHAKGGAAGDTPRVSSDHRDASDPITAFRIAEEGGNTIFYWIDADYAYALTGKLARAEMTELASRVYRQLDR